MDIQNTWKDKMAGLKYLKKLGLRFVQPQVGHLKNGEVKLIFLTPPANQK